MPGTIVFGLNTTAGRTDHECASLPCRRNTCHLHQLCRSCSSTCGLPARAQTPAWLTAAPVTASVSSGGSYSSAPRHLLRQKRADPSASTSMEMTLQLSSSAHANRLYTGKRTFLSQATVRAFQFPHGASADKLQVQAATVAAYSLLNSPDPSKT